MITSGTGAPSTLRSTRSAGLPDMTWAMSSRAGTRRRGSAILVITAEDVARGHPQELRLDLVREAGVFQGKLGFWSTTLLLEQGVKGLPDMPSIPEIRFPRGNIEEGFDDVLAALRR